MTSLNNKALKEYNNLHPEINKNRLSKAKKILLLLNQFVPDLKNKTVLDLGCSNGIITCFLSYYVKNIEGVDMDISYTNKNKIPQNCTFTQSDILSLPIKENSIDIIICNHVYHWVEFHELFVSEIDRVLKPNGYLYFAGPTRFTIKGENDVYLAPILAPKLRVEWLKIWKSKKKYKLNYLFSNQIIELFKEYDVKPLFPYFVGLNFNSPKILFKLINKLNVISPTAVFLFKKQI